MYRVLHVMNGADSGGISTVVLNYYSHMDRSRIHFDIAITDKQTGNNGKKLESLGCNFYFLPCGMKNRIRYIIQLKRILKDGRYDCVHVHLNEGSHYALFAGIMAGTSKKIAHAHVKRDEKSISNSIRKCLANILIPLYADKLLACSSGAGEYVFGRRAMQSAKGLVLPNAIEVNQFRFNSRVREEVRSEFGIENDKYVIGSVGNLTYQKNHEFLIDVFYEVLKLNSNSLLIIVGSGDKYESLSRQCSLLGIQDKVIFTGKRSDADRLYQAFDVFALASRFEGFCVAAVEALTSGLNAVVSSAFGQFFRMENVKILSLSENKKKWAEEILKNATDPGVRNLYQSPDEFDIQKTAIRLEKIYLEN